MAAVGGAGLLQLSRGAGELRGAPDVPAGDCARVAGGAPASQPAASSSVGTVPLDHRLLSTSAADSASGARRAV